MEVSFGIGFGDIQVLHMGGVLRRVEFFVSGQALIKALAALRATKTDHAVAVSKEVWDLVSGEFMGVPDSKSLAGTTQYI